MARLLHSPGSMVQGELRPDASTVDLVKEALSEARELLQIEVALARDEVQLEIDRAKKAAIAFGAAVGAAVFGFVMLLVALSLAIGRGPIPALVIGLALLVLGAAAAVIGYSRVPRPPLQRTRSRLQTDARLLKEHVT